MPKISVIIPNWNGKHYLGDCLGSLRKQTFGDFETILVDNGSEDGSVPWVRTKFPEVNVIALPANRGFTGGILGGYEQATGELIVLLNNDTEANPNWLQSIHAASQAYSRAGSFASKMMYFDDRSRIENCGFDLGSGGTTIDLGRCDADGRAWAQPPRVLGAAGAGAAYGSRWLDGWGGLDERFCFL